MRQEFSAKIKLLAWTRAKGCCEECGPNSLKLGPGNIFFDHRIADALNGEPTLENCQVLCKSHHDIKTRKHDVPNIARAKRREKNAIGIKKPRSIRAWRKMNGDPVFAPRER